MAHSTPTYYPPPPLSLSLIFDYAATTITLSDNFSKDHGHRVRRENFIIATSMTLMRKQLYG